MGWLFNRGSDHDLANSRYAGRESASDSASRQRRQGHRRNATKADRKGQAWEERTRPAYPSTTPWFRSR